MLRCDESRCAAQAEAAKRQFPALTFDPGSAKLLRIRRCRACRAVRARLLETPPLPTCDAATRLHIQLPECPELPKFKPKPKQDKAQTAASQAATASAPSPQRAQHEHAMRILDNLMHVSYDLAQDMVDDAKRAGAAEPLPKAGSPDRKRGRSGVIDIRCTRPPRSVTTKVKFCKRPGAPGFGLAAYGACLLRASRGRLVCSRMAVVPAAGAPRSLLSTMLPLLLPGRVIAVEVHVHESAGDLLHAGGGLDAFDDGTGPQLDMVWEIVGRESKQLGAVISELEVRFCGAVLYPSMRSCMHARIPP